MSDTSHAPGGSAAERHTLAVRLLADAQAATAAGDWTRAAEVLQRVLAIAPGHAEATARLALVRERAGRGAAGGHGMPRLAWVLLLIGVVIGALAAIAAGVWVAS